MGNMHTMTSAAKDKKQVQQQQQHRS